MTHDVIVNLEITAHLDRHAPSANVPVANAQFALT
jgi:hypothetical protein